MKNSLLLALFFVVPAHARWIQAKESDASVTRQIRIQVDKDASVRTETETKIKVANETGRVHRGTLRFNYSPKNEKLKLMNAQTQNDTGVFKVERREIVDTPINATEHGFDQSRQIVVSFPQVQVGSLLSYRSEEEIFRPFIDNQYSTRIYFGYYDVEEGSSVTIRSRRPLHFEVNDPGSLLKLTRDEHDGSYNYEIRQTGPIVHRIVDEVRSIMDEKRFTWVTISTAGTYPELFGDLAGRYEKILQQPLPERFKPLVETARAEKTPAAQINSVLSGLADRIRYMGDWRAVDGAYIPRPMETIADTRYGDCKDMSIVTAKILRELGMTSHVALTIRAIPPRQVGQVPYLAFNHAIVTIQVGERRLWVDPTNPQSFAEGVFEDIAGRDGLVMDPQHLQLLPIAFLPAESSVETVRQQMTLLSAKVRLDKISLDITGAKAIPVTGAELRYSRAQFEDGTLNNFTDRSDVIRSKFGPWKLLSRVVEPFHLEMEYERHFHPTETSMGEGLEFEAPEDVRDLAKVDRTTRESPLKLQVPYIADMVTQLENIDVLGSRLRACTVQSPWIDYEFRLRPKPWRVQRKMTIKCYLITRDEIRSPEFARFQDDIRSCGRGKYLIFNRRGR